MNHQTNSPHPQNTSTQKAHSTKKASSAKKRRRRKNRAVFAMLLLFSVMLFAAAALWNKLPLPVSAPVVSPSPSPSPVPTATPVPEPETTTIHFSATGDNLIHDVLYKQAARRAGGNGYDFTALYENIAPFYQNYDVNWLNQETLVNDVYEPSNYPAFSSPGALGKHMYDIGFRVFSLSNNHTYDKGAGGITATREFWNSMPEDCLTVGLSTDDSPENAVVVQTVKGVKIAYVSYTEHTNGIPKPSSATEHVTLTSQTDLIQQQVEYARTVADFVVVGLHWGNEDSHGIRDDQRNLAQSIADWGADVIIGTHPHVVQDLEWKTSADGRQVLVAYSLGNFVSGQSAGDNMLGMILTFDLSLTKYPDGTTETSVSEAKAWPIVNHYGWGHSNITCYFFSDYTPEMAANHGVKKYSPQFSYDYAKSVFENNISAEFLQMG